MRITKDTLRTLWYEDANGNFVGEPDWKGDVGDSYREIVKTAKYQVSRFPFDLATRYLSLETDEEGNPISREAGVGTSTWSQHLVLAMANSGDYNLYESIIISAESCERCLNVLLFKYTSRGSRGDHGYPELSPNWKKCGTECNFCKGMGWDKPLSVGGDFYIVLSPNRVVYRRFVEEMSGKYNLSPKKIYDNWKHIHNPVHLRGITDSVEGIIKLDGWEEVWRDDLYAVKMVEDRIEQKRRKFIGSRVTRHDPPTPQA